MTKKEKNCCANCAKHFKIQKLDYSESGCKHEELDGFICMIFADEGLANYMIGTDENEGLCEEYSPKSFI